VLNDGIGLSPQFMANKLLTDHFRCSDNFANLTITDELSGDHGYFRFGEAGICYGQCSSGAPAAVVTGPLHDARDFVGFQGASGCKEPSFRTILH